MDTPAHLSARLQTLLHTRAEARGVLVGIHAAHQTLQAGVDCGHLPPEEGRLLAVLRMATEQAELAHTLLGTLVVRALPNPAILDTARALADTTRAKAALRLAYVLIGEAPAGPDGPSSEALLQSGEDLWS